MGREKKERVEADKKKLLKSIKIANDYLDLFEQSSEFFDQRISECQHQLDEVQDKLVLVWSGLCYLSGRSPSTWVTAINEWIALIDSSVSKVESIDEVIGLM